VSVTLAAVQPEELFARAGVTTTDYAGAAQATEDRARIHAQINFKALAHLGSLIPLKAATKEPLVKWKPYQRRRPKDEELRRWQDAWPDCNWGLIPAPDLIIVETDSTTGKKWLSDRGGIPITPIVLTTRGSHIYLRRPKELRGLELPARLHNGVEIIKTYAVVPPSLHPSGSRYQWLISPEETEIAEPHPWMIDLLKKRARKRKKTSSKFAKRWPNNDHPARVPSDSLAPKELFGHRIWQLGLCRDKLSCNSLVVTRAIVHFNLGHDFDRAYAEVAAWQSQFSDAYKPQEIRKKVLFCYERKYACNPKILAALTGLEYELCAQFVKLLIDHSPFGFRGERERKSERLSSFEISRRLMLSTIGYIVPQRLTIKELARRACIPESTLKCRIHRKQLPPLLRIVAIRGRNGGILVWNLWMWLLIGLLTTSEEKVASLLMCIYGACGVGKGAWGSVMRVWPYAARAPTF